jgi:gluconolactonase
MQNFNVLATGLLFPEGPVALPDGSIALVEIQRETISRVAPDGTVSVIANVGGGPNGLAIGPEGAYYLCNNGGFLFQTIAGFNRTRAGVHPDYTSGRIERFDPATGELQTLYDRCGDFPLRGPNDLVFDHAGGFYFTDFGKNRARDRDHAGLYYGRADGSMIVEVAYPLTTANGVGLSPDDSVVYVSETETGAWPREEAPASFSAWRQARVRLARLSAIRQHGRGRIRQYLRRDARDGMHNCDYARRRCAAAGDAA